MHFNLNSDLDVLIVGAGLAGLCMLHKSRQQGLKVVAIEAGEEIGGTWYFNRYPGARVDIQSLEYSFGFSEELQQEWRWTERYAAQPEILRYVNHVADRFQLREDIRLSTRVISAVFEESLKKWVVTLSTGEKIYTQFLVMAGGSLSSPSTPDIAGMDTFAGEIYHTAHWPKEAVDLRGKRVAVIGTGSSAVQIIPEIAKQVESLTVFQRTAAYCVPARNAPMDVAYEAKIKSDYAGFRQRNKTMQGGYGADNPPNVSSALSATSEERNAVFEERWAIGGIAFLGAFGDLLTNMEANGYAAEFIRKKIREAVHDSETAKILSPTHAIGCKRICIDTGYYETFNQRHVHLVDVNKEPLRGFTSRGVHFGETNLAVDAIVMATGFDAMTGTIMRLNIRGYAGQTIQEKWANGPLNYLGLAVANFPNFFNIAGPGSASAFTNVIVSIEHHVNWIFNCIQYMKSRGYSTIAAGIEEERLWVERVNSVASKSVMTSCNSWYQGSNVPGKPRVFMPMLGFPAYAKRCDEVARDGYSGFYFS